MNDFGLSADIAKEKLYAGAKIKKQQEQQQLQQESLQKQAPSQTTGLQWARQQATVSAAQENQKTENSNAKITTGEPAIVTPEIEDIATLSSLTPVKPESVKAPRQKALTRLVSNFVDVNALQESFKEYYKKSKSHNLLLERFMSHIKFSGVKTLLSLIGVGAKEQIRMQEEVRQEALAEIEAKLKEDWAYTKAMLEITG